MIESHKITVLFPGTDWNAPSSAHRTTLCCLVLIIFYFSLSRLNSTINRRKKSQLSCNQTPSQPLTHSVDRVNQVVNAQMTMQAVVLEIKNEVKMYSYLPSVMLPKPHSSQSLFYLLCRGRTQLMNRWCSSAEESLHSSSWRQSLLQLLQLTRKPTFFVNSRNFLSDLLVI